MRMNPILKKELKLGSRTIKLPLALMFYNIVLALIALVVIGATGFSAYIGSYSYSSLLNLFPVLACVQCGIIIIIVPILTAASISGERERQTLDVMLTTPVSSFSIVTGKLFSAIANVLMYVISSIPIMSIAFVLGGLNWFALIGFVFVMLYIAFYVGSIGVFCSSLVKRTIASVVLTILFIAIIFAGTLVLFGIVMTVITVIWYAVTEVNSVNYSDPTFGFTPAILLLNPLSIVFDYIFRVMGWGSIAQMIEETESFSVVMEWVAHLWIPISGVLNLGVAFGFLGLAARRVNPIKKVKYKGGPVMQQPVQQMQQPPVQPVPVQQPPVQQMQQAPVQPTPVQTVSQQQPPTQQ